MSEVTAESKWIKENEIKKRVCIKYVTSKDNPTVCVCGYKPAEHVKKVKDIGQFVTWTEEDNTCLEPTDAFGDIDFLRYGHKTSKYIRVDHKTDQKLIIRLMKEQWGLKKSPNLLISITGGAKKYQPHVHTKEVFKQGLMKAAASTGAWIVTGGMHAGIMRQVGEAVREYSSAHGIKVTAIGVASWGNVYENKILSAKSRSSPTLYNVSDIGYDIEASSLDPNHSHFILVDNGTNIFGAEIDFRAELEKAISEMDSTGDNNNSVAIGAETRHVPIVSVCVEGGTGTLKTVRRALQAGTPVVIVEGSGRVADILAYAYRNKEDKSYFPNSVRKKKKVPTATLR